jgi:hypothetical protein
MLHSRKDSNDDKKDTSSILGPEAPNKNESTTGIQDWTEEPERTVTHST